MSRRTRKRPRGSQVKFSTRVVQLTTLAVAGGVVGRWGVLAIALLVVLTVASVLLTAVWSRKTFRRHAARDVLELIIRALEALLRKD